MRRAERPEFREMLRAISIVDGFLLISFEVGSPRDIDELVEFLRAVGRPVDRLRPVGGDWVHLVEWLGKRDRPDGSVIVIDGGFESGPERRAALRLLNQRRDSVLVKTERAVIVVGSGEFMMDLADIAPDVWSVRGMTIWLTPQDGAMSVGRRSNAMSGPMGPSAESTWPVESAARVRQWEEDASSDRATGDIDMALDATRSILMALLARARPEDALARADDALRDLGVLPSPGTSTTRHRRNSLLLDLHVARSRALAQLLRLDEAVENHREHVLPNLASGLDRARFATEIAAAASWASYVTHQRGWAREALATARAIFEAEKHQRGIATALAYQADWLSMTGEHSKAADDLRSEVIPRFDALGDPEDRCRVRFEYVQILGRLGQTGIAMHTLEHDVRPLARTIRDMGSRISVLNGLTSLQERLGDTLGALRVTEAELVPLWRQWDDECALRVGIGKFVARLAESGRHADAIEVALGELIPLREKARDAVGVAAGYAQVAESLAAMGRNDEARQRLQNDAIPRLERAGDVGGRAGALLLLSELVDDASEASAMRWNEVRPALPAVASPTQRIALTRRLLAALIAAGEADRAVELTTTQLLPDADATEDPGLIAESLSSVAELLEAQGRWDAALDVRTRELAAWERAGSEFRQASTHLHLSSAALQLHDPAAALRNAQAALQIFETLGFADAIEPALDALAEAHSALGQADAEAAARARLERVKRLQTPKTT